MSQTSDFQLRAAVDSDSEAVRALIFSVMAEFGLGTDPKGADADLDQVASYYASHGGWFDIIERAGQIVGTVGMLPRSDTQVELRKMYLLPVTRGAGLGSALLARSIAQARDRGFSEIILETATVLKAAIALYTRFGFERVHDEFAGCGKTACDQVWHLQLAQYREPVKPLVDLRVL